MNWAEAPSGLSLDVNYIDVWRSQLDLPEEEIQKYCQTLSKEELQRAEKFTFPDKYEEYVITRGLLRCALALVLQKSPSEFVFGYTTEKKPFLKQKFKGQPISFNVSHSHGQVLVAISLDRNIGIDIELIRQDVEYEKLAKRFFSDNESQAMMESPVDEQVDTFFTIWTRKEAFVKAIGKGIAFGLAEFDVNVSPHEPPKLLATRWNPDDVSKWRMTTIETEKKYKATLAADGGPFETRLWR